MYKFNLKTFLFLFGLTSLVVSDRLYGTNYGSYRGVAQNHGPPAFGPDPSHGQAGTSHGTGHGIINQCVSPGHCENEQGRFHIPQVGNKRCLVCKEVCFFYSKIVKSEPEPSQSRGKWLFCLLHAG